MDQQKADLIKKISESTNVLVAVSNSPSVDQLAASIGLTLVLNKLGKHATSVFSGAVPSTIEFLKPEETLEKNTDSLRDFIIALDKSKADKLRYKVEDQHVKIFITPYRTSITDKDLEFSQGDFNVDVVVALGVHEQSDLDQAITAHGRILHDATIVSVNNVVGNSLGSTKWENSTASSICEMVSEITDQLGKDALDDQIATALLTGIVAETSRFSNEKTTATTMSISSKLMAAGANQQLVASKLEEPADDVAPEVNTVHIDELANEVDEPPQAPASPDTLEINHEALDELVAETSDETPEETEKDHQIHVDEHGQMRPAAEVAKEESAAAPLDAPADTNPFQGSRRMTEAPSRGGTLTGMTQNDEKEQMIDPLNLPAVDQTMLSHDSGPAQPSSQVETPQPEIPETPEPIVLEQPEPAVAPEVPADVTEPAADQTLESLERAVNSTHIEEQSAQPTTDPTAELDAARSAVLNAINTGPDPAPEAIQALNAMPFELPAEESALPRLDTAVTDPTAPPTVPPPMMPPTAEFNFPADLNKVDGMQSDDQQPPINPFNLPPAA